MSFSNIIKDGILKIFTRRRWNPLLIGTYVARCWKRLIYRIFQGFTLRIYCTVWSRISGNTNFVWTNFWKITQFFLNRCRCIHLHFNTPRSQTDWPLKYDVSLGVAVFSVTDDRQSDIFTKIVKSKQCSWECNYKCRYAWDSDSPRPLWNGCW